MRLTPDEHAEVARLLRQKLASLRAQEPIPPREPRRSPIRTFSLPDQQPADDDLLTSGEVGELLGVSRRAVANWDVPCRYTLGGHRRYRWGQVRDWIAGSSS